MRTLLAFVAVALVAIVLLVWLMPILDRHEGTAAWVQAIGALLIIAATAYISNRQSRETRDRELRAADQLKTSIVGLAQNALDALDTLLKACPPDVQTSDPRGQYLRSYAPGDFEVPMDGLAAIPLHQLGEADLITSILTLRGTLGRIKKRLDDIQRDPVLSQNLQDVRNQRVQVFNAVASIFRIVEGYAAEEKISRLVGRI